MQGQNETPKKHSTDIRIYKKRQNYIALLRTNAYLRYFSKYDYKDGK